MASARKRTRSLSSTHKSLLLLFTVSVNGGGLISRGAFREIFFLSWNLKIVNFKFFTNFFETNLKIENKASPFSKIPPLFCILYRKDSRTKNSIKVHPTITSHHITAGFLCAHLRAVISYFMRLYLALIGLLKESWFFCCFHCFWCLGQTAADIKSAIWRRHGAYVITPARIMKKRALNCNGGVGREVGAVLVFLGLVGITMAVGFGNWFLKYWFEINLLSKFRLFS